MISKEQFVKAIESIEESNKFIYDVKRIGLELYETPLNYTIDSLFEIIMESNFTGYGIDLIYWYLYEKCEGPETIENLNGDPIIVDTADDLWRLVNDCIL